MRYFPNSTKKSDSAQLGRWIRGNEKLKSQLLAIGYKPQKNINSNPVSVDCGIIWGALTVFSFAIGRDF